MPVAPRIEAEIGAADQAGAVHQPHRRRAVGVLPEDVGLAVGVEIARTDFMPIGAGMRTPSPRERVTLSPALAINN
jgi:hypothetical protein